MNANDNLENRDLKVSNITPVSDTEMEENKDQKQELTEQESSQQLIDETEVQTPSETETASEEEAITDADEATDLVKEEEKESTSKPQDEEKASGEGKEKLEEEVKDVPVEDKQETIKADEPSLQLEDTQKEEKEETVADKSEDSNKKSDAAASLTFAEIVTKLRDLSNRNAFSRKELEKFQYLFLNEAKKEMDVQKQNFIAEGGKEENFAVKESDLHAEGKSLLQVLAEKRKQIAADEEKTKEKNLARKLAIIEEVKTLTESQDDFNRVYQDFKSLQQEWNNIRLVPHGKEHELWNLFQEQVEKFYDLVRIHNEFRDYDFKKNLETKSALCESAEKLTEEEDIVSAFHQLQKLHRDWRDIGPVARKDREVIWQRFKEASALINKNYQAHIETLKDKENENYEKKVAICEQLESIDFSVLKIAKDWEIKMREVLDLQAQWREIGYAPRKVNKRIFQRYRAACDLFFKHKNTFYQSIRGELEENLKKKIELCERAEAMKDSQDWKNTTQDMIAIQREWKEIGMVPRRNSSSIWRRFIAACDHFFEQKKLYAKSQRQEEVENLNLKKEINEKIKNIDTNLSDEDALKTLRDLMTEWQAVGYVPYNDKDKAYKEFLEATDIQYARLKIDKSERKLETFKSNITEMTRSDNSRGQVYHERDKLMRQFERMKSELQTYENNVGFLSSSSKKGNVLVDDMNNKIENIKAELELIIKKIDAIDEKI
ncbi:MAG: DUF349 domain-containing protein [Dysgonamonadaceae bacterium]|nr:DUF349 domain-containing protein [Dysgonamonadaceae bacterium]MDD4727984.1 DUF349 domain-containing protein [Dysgonamonadaceae bacterium]